MLNINKCWFGLVCSAVLLVNTATRAADAKSYQVTGPVLEVTPTVITVQKGNDKMEITRNSSTKVTGDLKPGAKVTIYYTMVATEVEVKAGKSQKRRRANPRPNSPPSSFVCLRIRSQRGRALFAARPRFVSESMSRLPKKYLLRERLRLGGPYGIPACLLVNRR